MKENWYVLYTSSRAEKRVEERLKNEGYITYLPLHKAKRKWSDRIKVVEIPLFNSYIFVYCDEYRLRGSLMLPGISRILYYLGKPAIVKQSELDAIEDFLKIAEGNKVITKGDEVEIICGPFQKVSGKVINIDKKYSMLYLEQLGATVCIETINIEKVKNEE